jgi:ketosteroid isomerase-like protein
LAELYRGYGNTIMLESAGDLAVHHDREASVVVLEYAVHGRIVATGKHYDNRFVSIITIRDRRVTHWRDYLDSLAVVGALGVVAPAR